MAKMVVSHLGGVMAKTVRVSVFLEPKTYMEIVNEAHKAGITHRNDSELIRKIIYKFFQSILEIEGLNFKIEKLTKANAEKKTIIEALQDNKTK